MATPDFMHEFLAAGHVASVGPPKRASGTRRIFLWLEYICWILGAAALGYFLFISVNRIYFQSMEQRQFAELQREAATSQVHPGDLLGKLTIPRIGLSAMVLQGDDEATLGRAIGHIPDTSLPDGFGTVGLAAHRDTFFRNLGSLHTNDTIRLETRNGIYTYRVATTAIVDPTNIEVLRPHGRQALTLVTCYPFHYIGSAPRRYVVTAWEVSETQKAPR